MTVVRQRLVQVAAHFAIIDVALFTTFTFNADFFEQNVLPALFGGEPEDRRAMREARVHKGLLSTRVATMYDASLVKPSKRRFRYAALPVYLGPERLFHPKNIILFGRDADGERWIYVATMSANLSISGWGQNKEGFADIWIHAKSEQPAKELRDYLQWVQKRRSRADVLLAAIEAWEELRSQRGLVDPDGIRPDAKRDLRLYFSPLHQSLWSFLKEEYGALQSVVAGSPYWGSSSQAARELKGIDLELIASRCAPNFKTVNLGKDTLSQLYSDEASTPRVHAWRGEAGRFHHLKVYRIRTGRGEFTGLGSCNFTDRGQFWNAHGNVEAMLFDRVSLDLPPKAPLTNGDLPLESRSDDPPSILPAYVSLQYNWRNGTFSWRLEGNTQVLPATLQIPDRGEPVLMTPAEIEGERKGELLARTFTFAFQCGEVHTGLVEELNVAESSLVYGRPLPARDILESWRAGSAAEPDPPADDDTEEKGKEESALPEDEVLEPKPKEEPFDWFLFYRCVQDMRARLEQAKDDPRLLADLVLIRSDSVIALSDSVLAGSMMPVGNWLVVKECVELLKPYRGMASLLKGRLRRLEMQLQTLKEQVERDIENELLMRRVSSKPAELVAWYDHQLSAAVRQ